MALLIVSVAVVFLVLGSYFDLKTGEIPEKISYGFISTALIISAVDSFYNSDIHFFLNSLFIGLAFFTVSFILFYTGQWGGGDVKLMAGIGCALGYLGYVGYFTDGLIPYYLTYFINMAFIAFPYIIIYGLVLGVRNPRTWSEFWGCFGDTRIRAVLLLSTLPSLAAFYLGLYPMATIYLVFPPLVVSTLYLKVVEETILRRRVKVSDLREGDIVVEDVVVGGEKIACKRNIEGVSGADIGVIKKLALTGKIPDEIRIKEGFRLAPVLFMTFVSVLWAGNFMEIVILYSNF